MKSIKIRRLDELDFLSNEAYKTLRTNIQFCGSDNKVIALTSCTPNEGKTSVSFNLARSLADLGKKVLFIPQRRSIFISAWNARL